MTFAFGPQSRSFFKGLDPRLTAVLDLAITLSEVDFKVICGVRTLAEQKALYAQGRTKPGKIVTWTLNSRHLLDPKTGFGRAVDLLPAPYDWKVEDDRTTPEQDDAFIKLNEAMQKAAHRLGIPIRWGANWNGNTKIREKGETDNPHWELAP